MNNNFARLRFIAFLALAAIAHAADDRTPTEFDVASIKPNNSGVESFGVSTSAGGRLVVKNITVNRFIQLAFDIRPFQLSEGPSWTGTERFDINAKADTPERPTLTETNTWCQALLVSRFALKFHWETRQLPEYFLLVAKGGPKLQPNKGAPGPEVSYGKGWIETSKTTVAEFAAVLARSLEGSVVDDTSVQGVFDFKLRWTPDETPDHPSADPSGPSIFAALKEQLGLSVESRKGPVKVMVVDHVEHPTEN